MAKLSIGSIDKVLKDTNETIDVKWIGNVFTVRKLISLEEVKSFVDGVVELCFGDDGEYLPENKDFAIRLETIKKYADINIPVNKDKQYSVCYADGLVAAIICNVDCEQYSAILEAVDAKLDNIADAHTQYLYSSIADATTKIQLAMSKINEAMGSINSEDLQNAINAIKSGSIDEEKLVDAYFKAKNE